MTGCDRSALAPVARLREYRVKSIADWSGTGPEWGKMKARGFSCISALAAFAGVIALLAGSASASDPGDVSVLGGSNDYCVSEDGNNGNGNPNGCIDGKGLTNSISALQVSPDGKRLFVLGFDGFLTPVGDSITTYDRNSSRGSLSVDPRINACRSAPAVPDCSQGGSQAVLLQAPTGLAISPDSNQVYVSARRTHSITVFDYLAIDSPLDPSGFLGPLAKKPAPNGCVTEAAQAGCLDGRALSRAFDVVISPDGSTVYTAGNLAVGGGIGVFDRASDGVLTQKSGTDGCVNDTGDFGCANGSHLEPVALAISADGKNLYAASNEPTSSITIFDIDPDGTIEQKPGPAGCSTRDGSGGDCTPNPYLRVPVDIAITPDGESVYVATDLENFEDAPDVAPLVDYGRNTANGNLTSLHCFAAEAAFGCAETAGLYRPLTVEATDEAVYVGSRLRNADHISGEGAAPGGLVILNRTGSDFGEVSQKPVEGCWTPTEFDDCVTLSTISTPRAIDVSPDGDSLYVGGDRITVFNRNDGTEPDSTIESGPTGETLSTNASFTFSGDKPDVFFECSLDSTDLWQECSSPQAYTNLSPGQHTFRVRATDVFDQVESTPAERSWTVTEGVIPPTCETDPSLCPDPPDTKVDAVVTVAKLQKQKARKISIAVKVRANEPVTAKITGSVKKGKVKAGLKPVTKKLSRPGTILIHVRAASAKSGRLVAAALLGSKRTAPKIFITLTDGAMNRLVKKPKIKIQGAPKRR